MPSRSYRDFGARVYTNAICSDRSGIMQDPAHEERRLNHGDLT